MKSWIDSTTRSRRWLSLVAMAAAVAACGGGGGTTAGGVSGGGDSTGNGGGSDGPVAGLPNVPSGYVRYQVSFRRASDPEGKGPGEALLEEMIRACNEMRVAAGADAQQVSIASPHSLDEYVEEEMYDARTGAGRKERRRTLLNTKARQPAGPGLPPDCTGWPTYVLRETDITARDGTRYLISYDANETPVKIRHVPPAATPPSGIVEWGADWTGKTIAGAKCIELPADFGGLPKGWSRCNWDIYRDIRVRNLPLALEEVRNTAGLLYHRIADYTTTRRENFLGGWDSREVDWLPEGVPIEEHVH